MDADPTEAVDLQPVAITAPWARPVVPDEAIAEGDPADCRSAAHRMFFWWVFWEQGIQFDQPGVYEVRLALGSTHQLTDGFDGDQDGALDRFGPGLIVEGSLIVNVEAP